MFYLTQNQFHYQRGLGPPERELNNSRVIVMNNKFVDVPEIKRIKENPAEYFAEKREKKNQQRIEMLSNKLPSQEELFKYMVDRTLKPSNK